MRKFLYLLMLPFVAVAMLSCGDEESDYNADAAVTSYVPTEGRMVASVKTTKESGGRLYSWEHKFTYDAKKRIKNINSDILYHYKSPAGIWYRCNVSSTANYYFKSNDYMTVRYNINYNFPEYTAWNDSDAGVYGGTFDKDGRLMNFGPFDCDYSNGIKAYMDNGRIYTLQMNSYGNVTGYVCDSLDVRVATKLEEYSYSGYDNNTNFDFSAYIGNWVIEREIPDCVNWQYAPFQLAAFGMFGYGGKKLPLGEWEMEGNYPVVFTDFNGYRTEIKYVE